MDNYIVENIVLNDSQNEINNVNICNESGIKKLTNYSVNYNDSCSLENIIQDSEIKELSHNISKIEDKRLLLDEFAKPFASINDNVSNNVFNDHSDKITTSNLSDSVSAVATFNSTPQHVLLYEDHKEFAKFKNNYIKGCKWSPDGTSLLTCSNDNCLRNFKFDPNYHNEPRIELTSKVMSGDLVYDFEWYPYMNSSDEVTCCYVTTSRDQPIHLRDSLDGSIRCSYRSFNQMDELAPVSSLAFSPDGQKLYCGLEKMIKIFDISQPGREFDSRPTYVKMGQHGIISCIAFNNALPSMYAAGSYSKSVAIYCEPTGEMMCMLLGQRRGVTHIKFSQDGNRLYSGGRKDCEILCWDVRQLGQILYILQRDVQTNQRFIFNFDLTGRYLFSGNQNGSVSVWDTKMAATCINGELVLPILYSFPGHDDALTSISMHPNENLLATGCGQRHFHPLQCSDSEDDISNIKEENSLKIWKINNLICNDI